MADVTCPALDAAAITPSDTVDLSSPTRGIYVGTSGDLKVDMYHGDTAVTFVSLAAGVIHPIRVKRVYSTGTDADNIVGIW